MKKFLLAFFCLSCASTFAGEPAYEAANLLIGCLKENKDCEKVEPAISNGLNYYLPKKNASLEDRKKYCGVVGVAARYYFSKNIQKAMQYNAIAEYECQGLF